MKPVFLLFLFSTILLAGCNPGQAPPLTKACLQSCDDILMQLSRASSIIDDATLAARTAGSLDDAGQLFLKSGDELDELAKIVKARAALREMSSFQLTEEILSTSTQASDDLQRLVGWAGQFQEGEEFFGNLLCAYRDAYRNASTITPREPTYGELGAAFLERYSNAPPDAESVKEAWLQLVQVIQQQDIDIWDSSITLYCVITGLKPD